MQNILRFDLKCNPAEPSTQVVIFPADECDDGKRKQREAALRTLADVYVIDRENAQHGDRWHTNKTEYPSWNIPPHC